MAGTARSGRAILMEQTRIRHETITENRDRKCHLDLPRDSARTYSSTVHSTVNTMIWYRFMDFNTDFYERRKAEGFSKGDLKMMPVSEYIAFIRDWLKDKA